MVKLDDSPNKNQTLKAWRRQCKALKDKIMNVGSSVADKLETEDDPGAVGPEDQEKIAYRSSSK